MPEGKFRGFHSPTTTPVPDQIFDELMAEISGAELKVLLYICRRTFGFKKDDDNISISQMLKGITKKDGKQLDHGAGLSKPTLLRAIKSLKQRQVIIAEHRSSTERGDQATNYRLNFADPRGKKMIQGESQSFTRPVVKKRYPQQTGNNKQLDNTVNGDRSPVLRLPTIDQPADKTYVIAADILDAMGDDHSRDFYRQVAAHVPESVIRTALAEIKADGGADHPPAVFTARMNEYALQQLRKSIG